MKKMKIMAMLTAFMLTTSAFQASVYAETEDAAVIAEVSSVDEDYLKYGFGSGFHQYLLSISVPLHENVYKNNLDVKYHSSGLGGYETDIDDLIYTDVRYTSTSQKELDEVTSYCKENGIDMTYVKLVYVDPILFDIEVELNEFVEASGFHGTVTLSLYDDIAVKFTSDLEEEIEAVKNYCEDNEIASESVMLIKRKIFDEETVNKCYELLSQFIDEQNIPFDIQKENFSPTTKYYNGRIRMGYYYPDAIYKRLINKFIEDNSIDADIIGGYEVAEVYEEFSISAERLENVKTLLSEYVSSESLNATVKADEKVVVTYPADNAECKEAITKFMSENYILEKEVEFTETESSEPTKLIGDVNDDNELNVRDCAVIASAVARGDVSELEEDLDFNDDGKINVRDAAAIASYLANK